MIGFLLTQTAEIQAYKGYRNGDDAYAEPETRKCRVQYGKYNRHLYKDPSGEAETITANAKMFTTGDPIPPRSIVTVDGQRMTVTDCYIARGFSADHLEVYLG